MSEMLKPEDRLSFGKYKGKELRSVAETDPGYLCWLRKTGFSSFGKDITEFIFAWEEQNADEVRRIERSIERKKREEAARIVADPGDAAIPDDTPAPRMPVTPAIPKEVPRDWGSW